MNVGDKLTWTPSGFDHEVSGQRADKVRKLRSVTGVVAYICRTWPVWRLNWLT